MFEKENKFRIKPPSKEGQQEEAGKEMQPYFNIQFFKFKPLISF